MRARAVVALLLLAGCRDAGSSDGPAPSAEARGVATSTDAPEAAPLGAPSADDDPEIAPEEEDDPSAACAPKDPSLKPMQLLRFEFTSGLEGKDPRDRLQIAHPSQKVFAHLTMRNRSGRRRCIKLDFRINGKHRPEITLEVGKSWSWRTWAYSTPRADDDGHIELTVRDDQGETLLLRSLPIVPR